MTFKNKLLSRRSFLYNCMGEFAMFLIFSSFQKVKDIYNDVKKVHKILEGANPFQLPLLLSHPSHSFV